MVQNIETIIREEQGREDDPNSSDLRTYGIGAQILADTLLILDATLPP